MSKISEVTVEKIKIMLSKMDLEQKKNVAKRMIKDNDYLFILDEDMLYNMINGLDNEGVEELILIQFDKIGILDEYCILIDDGKASLIKNNINIVDKDDYDDFDDDEFHDDPPTFFKLLTGLLLLILIISYIIVINY